MGDRDGACPRCDQECGHDEPCSPMPATDPRATVMVGPQAAQIGALLDRLETLTPVEVQAIDAARGAAGGAARYAARYAAWDAAGGAARYAAGDAAGGAARYAAGGAAGGAAWGAAWDAAGGAAGGAAWDAAWDAARYAAWDAARALLVRDLISAEHYDALTAPVRTVLGPIHPDDPPLTKENLT